VKRFLFDTAVFVYAVGAEHPYRDACREIIERAGHGELAGEASTDLIQEFVHQRARRTGDRREAVRRGRLIPELCRLHDVERRDVPVALALFSEHVRLTARDAFFAAVALNRGIDRILSPDRAFDSVPALQRVDPLDSGAVAALAAWT
jgi:predicted nucleic acid-binding protein